MKVNSITKGVLLVAVASCSYGILATVVKLALKDGYSAQQLTFSQAIMGFIGLLALNLLNNASGSKTKTPTKNDKLKLILGGFSIGLTSITYYLSLQYIPVAICMVLIMQSAWMGTLLELFVNKKKPSALTIFAIFLILLGTLLATDVFSQTSSLDPKGIFWGLISGFCYTFSLFSSNRIAVKYPPQKRSLYLILGSLLIIIITYSTSLFNNFNPKILYTWGIGLGLLGTIIPPLLFTRGMPIVGIGLGTIVASIELPASAVVAFFILDEKISFLGWLGIFLILFAIIMLNVKPEKYFKKYTS